MKATSTTSSTPGNGQYTPSGVAVKILTDNDTHSDGSVTATGTCNKGDTVIVTFPGVTTPVKATVTGTTWTVNSPKGTVVTHGQIGAKATNAYNQSASDSKGYDKTVTVVPNETTGGKVILTGTASPKAKVTLTYPGPKGTPKTTTVTADDKGHYTYTTPEGNVPAGPVKATSTTSSTSGNGQYTPAGVAVKIVSDTDTHSDGSVTATGTCNKGDTVVVTFPGVTTPVKATVTGSTWTATSPKGKVVIHGQVGAKATNAYNQSASDSKGYDKGLTFTGKATVNSDGDVIVTGTASPKATVVVNFPGTNDPVTVTATSDGTFTATSQGTCEVTTGNITATSNTSTQSPHEHYAPSGAIIGGLTPGHHYHINTPGGGSKSIVAGPDGTITLPGGQSVKAGEITITNSKNQVVQKWNQPAQVSAGTVRYTYPASGANEPHVQVYGATPHAYLKLKLPDGSFIYGHADASGNSLFPIASVSQKAGPLTVTASLTSNYADPATASHQFAPRSDLTLVNGTVTATNQTLVVNATPYSTVTTTYTAVGGKTVTQTFHIGANGKNVKLTLAQPVDPTVPQPVQFDIWDEAQGVKSTVSNWIYVAPRSQYYLLSDAIGAQNPGDNKPVVTVDLDYSQNGAHLPLGSKVRVQYPDNSYSPYETVTQADQNKGSMTFPQANTPQFTGPIKVEVTSSIIDLHNQAQWTPIAKVGPATVTNPEKNNKPTIQITGNIPGTTIKVTFTSGESSKPKLVPADGIVTFTATEVQPKTGYIHIVDSMGPSVTAHGEQIYNPLFIDNGGKNQPKQTIQVVNTGNNRPMAYVSNVKPGTIVTIHWPDGTTSPAKADNFGHASAQAPRVMTEVGKNITATDVDQKTPLSTPYTPWCVTGDGSFTRQDSNLNHPLFSLNGASPGVTMTATVKYADGKTQTIGDPVDANGTFTIHPSQYTDSSTVTQITYQATLGSGASELKGAAKVAKYTYSVPVSVTPLQDPQNLPKVTLSGMLPDTTAVTIKFPGGVTKTYQNPYNGETFTSAKAWGKAGNVTVTPVVGGQSGASVSGWWKPIWPYINHLTVTPGQNNRLAPKVTFQVNPGETYTVTYPGTNVPEVHGTAPLDGNGDITLDAPAGVSVINGNVIVHGTMPGYENHQANQQAPWTQNSVTIGQIVVSNASSATLNRPQVQLIGATIGSTVTVHFPGGEIESRQVTGKDIIFNLPNKVQGKGNIEITAGYDKVAAVTKDQMFTPKATIGDVVMNNNNNTPTYTITGASPLSKITVSFPNGGPVTRTTDKNGNVKITAPEVQSAGHVVISDSITSAAGTVTSPAGKYDKVYTPEVSFGKMSLKKPTNNEPGIVITGASPNTRITVKFPDNTSVSRTTDAQGNCPIIQAEKPQKHGIITVIGTLTGANTLTSKPITFDPQSYFGKVEIKQTKTETIISFIDAAPMSTVYVVLTNGTHTKVTDMSGSATFTFPIADKVFPMTVYDNAGSSSPSVSQVYTGIADVKAASVQHATENMMLLSTSNNDMEQNVTSDLTAPVTPSKSQGLISRFIQWFK